MKRSAAMFLLALVLSALAGCGGSKSARTPADLRGDAIRPVDKAPPEGTLSEPATQPERFTLRRSANAPFQRQDTVVRVNPPRRAVSAPDSATTAPPRTVTMTPVPVTASPRSDTASRAPGAPRPAAPATPSPDVPATGQFLQQDPAQVISRVPAIYPERARQARVGGTVLVKALVGTDGIVRATRIARSIPELDSAAVQCVRKWRFKPAMSSGVPVASWTDIPVRFLLQ